MRSPRATKALVLSALMLFSLVINAACELSDRAMANIDTCVDRNMPYKPSMYVKDKETAMRIAEAVWASFYGGEDIEAQKPFDASLKDGVWYVIGTGRLPVQMPNDKKAGVRIIRHGGGAMIKISASDGRIIGMAHGM